MPTIRSTSADRWPISSCEVTPCARIASRNWAPTDFTGLSAFMALCMTTDMSFQRTAARSLSLSWTRLRPRKVTLPPVISAGGLSSWAIPNSRVDLPQPDSPTMARNSPGFRSKLTLSTAPTIPLSSTYSTHRSRISSSGPGCGGLVTPGWSSASACAIAGKPPLGAGLGGLAGLRRAERAQRRVAYLVEGVVDERERDPQQRDAQPGHDEPQIVPGGPGRVLVGPVQGGAPAHVVALAEADELQAGAGQHRVQRVGQEAGQQQRGHGRDDLHHDDVERPLAADPGGQQEVPVAQRLGL